VITREGRQRSELNFGRVAKERFAGLEGAGFRQIESSPTFVRYRQGDIDVDIYHGR